MLNRWNFLKTGFYEGINVSSFHTIVAAAGETTAFITFGLHAGQGGPFDPSLNAGFLRSVDRGESWEPFGTGEVVESNVTRFAVSADGTVIYATVTDGYHHWISTDGGATWAKSSLNQGSGPVAVSPADPNIVIFRDSAQTTLFRSSDGLTTYSKVATTEGLSDDPDVRFAFDDVVFAPSDPSVDGGASFTLMRNIRSEVLNIVP